MQIEEYRSMRLGKKIKPITTNRELALLNLTDLFGPRIAHLKIAQSSLIVIKLSHRQTREKQKGCSLPCEN